MTQIEGNWELKLKNLKPVVFKEAQDYLMEKAGNLCHLMTNQHRQILKQFIDYHEFAESMIKERNYLFDKWRMFEHAYCITTPALEAEYAHDERTALSLYDCLIPRLREHRMLRVQAPKTSTELLEDVKTRERIC